MSAAPGAEHLAERALLLLDLRRPADAEREVRKALAGDPDNVDLHLILARALSRRGDTTGALDAVNHAIGLNPGFWYGHWVAGDVLSHAAREREALVAFHNALACDAEKPLIYEGIARGHYVLGEWRQTVQAAERGLRLEPDDLFLHEIIGCAFSKLGDHARACEHAARALRIDPESASAHRTYGMVARDAGDREAAIEAFREAMRLAEDPRYAADLLVHATRSRNPLHSLDGALWRVRLLPRRRLVWWLLALPFAPWFLFMALVTLGFWVNAVALAVTTLWMRRDPLLRRLLHDDEVRSARIALGALGGGAVLLGTSAALWSPTLLPSGIAVLALVVPVQEAGGLTRPGHRLFLRVAGLLGVVIAVFTVLAFAAPHLEWVFTAILLTGYVALGSIWPTMIVTGHRYPPAGSGARI
ncbi:tetratricopeptide repeat protein [Actinomadura spongiicola]|uniref:tetratricopeptide repeat protein n=1 Tax=Actinomadura spongiicola TaxID=2303421 RepID=UPI0013144276|nr:tetratricopeptide repeat protein [Actinomadura spongiicola]